MLSVGFMSHYDRTFFSCTGSHDYNNPCHVLWHIGGKTNDETRV